MNNNDNEYVFTDGKCIFCENKNANWQLLYVKLVLMMEKWQKDEKQKHMKLISIIHICYNHPLAD